MPIVHTRYFTDPVCPWSWALEPALRRLRYELDGQLQLEYVMSGMRRELEEPAKLAVQSLEAAAQSGMPVDVRGWLVDPPRSSHPACIAVLAAAEQGDPSAYLRRLREGFFCRRRKLDTADVLVAEAQAIPGLDLERFRLDLESNALLERFGEHLDLAQAVDPRHHAEGAGRVKLPSLQFRGQSGERHDVYGFTDFESLLAAAVAAGAQAPRLPPPSIEEALRAFGAMTTAEVGSVCRLPGPRAPAELWQLATEWRVRAERFLGGELWDVP